MVFHRGMRAVQWTSMSRMMRRWERRPQIHSFWAMNSLNMSFWIVPCRRAGSMPRSSASASYIASSTTAGALMVIEVLTWSSGMSANSRRMSSRLATDTPSRPTSPCDSGWSGS